MLSRAVLGFWPFSPISISRGVSERDLHLSNPPHTARTQDAANAIYEHGMRYIRFHVVLNKMSMRCLD